MGGETGILRAPHDWLAWPAPNHEVGAALTCGNVQGPLAAQVQLGSEEALSFQASFSPPPPSQAPQEDLPEADSAVPPPQRAASGPGQASPWAPQGILLAHLAEHTRAVNQLAVLQVQELAARLHRVCLGWGSDGGT